MKNTREGMLAIARFLGQFDSALYMRARNSADYAAPFRKSAARASSRRSTHSDRPTLQQSGPASRPRKP